MELTDPLDKFAVMATLIGLLLGVYFIHKSYQQGKYFNGTQINPYRSISNLKFVILFGNILLYPLIIKVLLGLWHTIPGLSDSILPEIIGLIGVGLIWISIVAAGIIYLSAMTNIYGMKS